MIKAEWTNKDSLDLQPTCNQLATNLQPTCNQLATTEGDFINRADAIKCIKWGEDVTDVIGRIKSLPSARPTGEWINEWKDIDGGRVYGACCSLCHTIGHWGYNFCPNCGADMRGDDNEAD